MVVHHSLYQWLVEWWDFLGGVTYHVWITPAGWGLLALIIAVIAGAVVLRKR